MAKTSSSFESLGSLVFSTNREMDLAPQEEDIPDVAPERQRLTVRRDTSGRKGKVVTLVQGFQGGAQALEELGTLLKRHCGTGGSAKDGEILIQGDVRQKAAAFLSGKGYKVRTI